MTVADLLPPEGDQYSATQVETAEGCYRKWAFIKVEGFPRVDTPSTAFGKAMHAQIAAYLEHGTPLNLHTPEGLAAMSGIHLLPRPGTRGMLIEKEFWLGAWGHRYLGYKDLEILDRMAGTPEAALPGTAAINWQIDPMKGSIVPLVLDHKSTKSFSYAKTPESLIQDPQATLYAAHAMVVTKAEAVDLRWVYYLSNQLKDGSIKARPTWQARPVDVRVTKEMISPRLERTKRTSDTLSEIKRKGYRALELLPSPQTCDAYGGCPFQAICNLTPEQKAQAIMTQAGIDSQVPGSSAFLEKVRAQAAAKAGAGVATQQPPAGGAPPGAPLSPDGKLFWDGTAWQPVPAAAPPPPPPPPPPPAPPPPPPPAAAPPPPPPPPPPAPAGAPPGAPLSPDGSQYWNGTAWVPIAAPPPPPPPNGSEESRNGPGRPPSAKTIAKQELVKALTAAANAIANGALD